MSGGTIRVNEGALQDFKKNFAAAGEEYIANLKKLEAFVNEVTHGDIQGDAAVALLNKFNEKKQSFQKIADIINDGQEYMGMKITKFQSTVSDISASIR